jgi:phage major head subunit gpT-like protein
MAQNYITVQERRSFDAAFLTYNAAFIKALKNTNSWWTNLAMEVPSNNLTTLHEWLGTVPGFSRWTSTRKFTGLGRFNYALTNEDWEGAGIKLSRNQILDSGENGLAPLAHVAEFGGMQAAKHPDRQVANLMKKGHTSGAAYKGFDGVSFFNASHPVDPNKPGGTTYRNYRTSFGLTQANFETVIAEIMTLPDENGDPLGLEAEELCVPPALRAQALTITQAALIANAAGTAGGLTNINMGVVKPRVIPELAGDSTDNASWYVTVKGPVKPFMRQLRQAAIFRVIAGLDSDHCAMEREVLMGADSREAYGYTLPQLSYKCIG